MVIFLKKIATPLKRRNSQPRSLSKNRNRNEGKLDLGRFFAFLKRIVTLFDEKKREMAQKSFWKGFSC